MVRDYSRLPERAQLLLELIAYFGGNPYHAMRNTECWQGGGSEHCNGCCSMKSISPSIKRRLRTRNGDLTASYRDVGDAHFVTVRATSIFKPGCMPQMDMI